MLEHHFRHPNWLSMRLMIAEHVWMTISIM